MYSKCILICGPSMYIYILCWVLLPVVPAITTSHTYVNVRAAYTYVCTNRVQEVMHRSALTEAPTNFSVISFLCHFTNSQPITIMPAKPKTARREHSNETISVILALHSAGKLYGKIADYVKISKSTVTRILQQASKNPNKLYYKIKRIGRSTKLNARSQRALICHIERFPHDNLATLGTSSKSGHILSRKMIRSYLKTIGYLQFKACRKPFLT